MIETKNTEAVCEKVRRKMRLEKAAYVEPNGIAGAYPYGGQRKWKLRYIKRRQ